MQLLFSLETLEALSWKNPAWDLFNHVPFDIIILETHNNYEQMLSIIDSCKKYNYIQLKGIIIREDFLD